MRNTSIGNKPTGSKPSSNSQSRSISAPSNEDLEKFIEINPRNETKEELTISKINNPGFIGKNVIRLKIET